MALPPPPPGWQPSVEPVRFPVTRPGKPRRLWLLAVVIVILALIVIAISLAAFSGAGAVHVQAVDWKFVGASCTGWSDQSFSGFNAGTNTVGSTTLSLTNAAPFGSCTAQSVSISTPGFTLTSSNVPVTDVAGQHVGITVQYQTPGSAFTGNLEIIVDVTTAA